MTDDARNPRLEVEAALFSAGGPVHLDDIAETTGLTRNQAREALKLLEEDYDDRSTALEVTRAGDKWTMQVRTAYAEGVRRLAPMEIPGKVLKTLALVAYHQPILQSDLHDMVGSKVYDHVGELADLGLVRRRSHERTYRLTTTEKFPEYFGLDTTDADEIKRTLAERVGIPIPQDDGQGNRTLPSFEDADPAAALAPADEDTFPKADVTGTDPDAVADDASDEASDVEPPEEPPNEAPQDEAEPPAADAGEPGDAVPAADDDGVEASPAT